MSRLATATIHLDALRHNLARLRELAAPARVMAVVKADAYGHGLERVARALTDADAFGVAAIADGRRLRAAGHRQRIVVLAGPDCAADLDELRRLDLDAVIHHDSQLAWLAADSGKPPIRVWLDVDSGMHRLGFPVARTGEVHARLAAMPSVVDDIVLMTHFAASDEFDNPLTAAQITTFKRAVGSLPGPRSLSNSAAVLAWPDARGEWVRAGGLLYGLSVVEGKSGADFGLRPAMTLATRLIAINALGKGERVGYPRSAASGTPVLVNGQRAAVAGRVSMDLLTIDLRGVRDATVGDPVVLWGPDLPVETIAAHAGTISYDLTCGMTRRVLFVGDDA